MEGLKRVTLKEEMDSLRIGLKRIGATLDFVKKEYQGKGEIDPSKEDFGEIMANLTLAYRHVEDASMRCGKVIQHSEGGESPYDKNVVGSK